MTVRKFSTWNDTTSESDNQLFFSFVASYLTLSRSPFVPIEFPPPPPTFHPDIGSGPLPSAYSGRKKRHVTPSRVKPFKGLNNLAMDLKNRLVSKPGHFFYILLFQAVSQLPPLLNDVFDSRRVNLQERGVRQRESIRSSEVFRAKKYSPGKNFAKFCALMLWAKFSNGFAMTVFPSWF